MAEWVYGVHPVEEALKAGRRRVEEILHARLEEETLAGLCAPRGIPLRRVASAQLDARLGTSEHQGVAARVSPYPYVSLIEALEGGRTGGGKPLFLVLDHLQDPHNLGAILRTAVAAGVHAVLLPADRSAAVTPAVVKASAGMAEHARVVRAGGTAQTLRELDDEGILLIGASADGDAPWTEMPSADPLAIVVGGEASGLRPVVRKLCRQVVRIPMAPPTESLNVSVAAAVLLFEVVRRRSGG